MEIQLSDHFTYPKLLHFSLPSILMMVFTSIYGIVDGFFVSNFAGKTPFTAVNFIMPFLMVLGFLGFMLGTGGCAIIGITLGEGRKKKANELFSLMVYAGIISGIVIALLGAVFMRQVGIFLGGEGEMLDLAVHYGRIVLIGLPSLMLQFEFQSFFVVAEKPNLGLYSTVAAGVMNMVLDALLVGVFALGIEGAAAATVVSQMTSAVIPLVYFSRENTSLLRLGKAQWDGRAMLRALGNGSSEFVSNISMSVVSMLYNHQLLKYAGQDGIAAYGVLMYVSMIFLAIFIGYAVGTAPIYSFHYGAGDSEELHSLLGKSLKIIGIFAILMFAAGELCSRPFAAMYVGYDDNLMALTTHAFHIFSWSFPCAALPIFGSSFFTALGDGLTSALISFLRTVVFEMGAVLLLPLIFGVNGIWYSLVVADAIAAAVTTIFLVTKRSKFRY